MANILKKDESQPSLPLLRAILLVLLDARNQPEQQTKPELLLDRAGISVKDISLLLDKKEDAVRKTITRAK